MRARRRRRFRRAARAWTTWAIIIAVAGGAFWARRNVAEKRTPHYVSSLRCEQCHAAEVDKWRGSNHARSMRVAAESTVAADFGGATYRYAGLTTTFKRGSEGFVANTDGPDGVIRDYAVRYTFGIEPLQQYLIALDGGRLQALSIAWDTRPRASGGQRWFHLYPNDSITHGDELHWTGIRQNWNYMCAECHSTGVRKNYDPVKRQFATTFAEVSVGCEACHGPGSRHVETRGRTRLVAQTRATQVEQCASCHARREQLGDAAATTRTVGDAHRVALLDDALYFPDGQIRDEVFEYGSFVQSKMYQRGVTCADCHDPHSGALRAPGSGVCAQCHAAEKYAAPSHHFHKADSRGADCISCHMPSRTYMTIDVRHDHSLRVPRPDLSDSLGVPNACTQCHSTQTAAWAAQQVAAWYGRPARGYQQYGQAFGAAARGDSAAPRLLAAVAVNPAQPAIARASAMQRLAPFATGLGLEVLRTGLRDSSALVRRAAAGALADVDPSTRASLLTPLLGDSVRDVRLEATRALAGVAAVDLNDLIASLQFNADRPEARLNLSLVYLGVRRLDDAERELRAALEIEPKFVPALINLADVYRQMRRDADAERALRTAIAADSTNGAAHHALGLLLVRAKRTTESLTELASAARLAPEVARYGMVYALALESAGDRDRASEVLARITERHPFDVDALRMVLRYALERGDSTKALAFARRLNAMQPGDAAVQQIVRRLTKAGN